MLKIIQKLVILWEKSKFLTLMQMESDYLRASHREILERDTDQLRSEVASLKAKKKMTADDNRLMIDLEGQINETEKYRQMMESSQVKGQDLENQIKKYRSELWRF